MVSSITKDKYCKFKSITLHKHLLESEAWNKLTKSAIKVFIYIWSCLQWAKFSKKRKKEWFVANNGDIEISSDKMRKKLGISKATCTTAIHLLIEVGLITLTRIGQNKMCHKYKILYHVVPQKEERWHKYPENNWKHECPTSPNNLVGKKTQFKTHPKNLNRKSDNQSTKVDRTNHIGLVKCTDKGIIPK